MNLGFDLVVESDGPDRAEDAPTSASMREGARGELRRRPSTDEKKVKNRLRREAGFDGDEGEDLEVVEGRILAAMAQKGRPWAELQALAAELEDIRSERRTAALRRDEINLADAVIHDHLTPVLTYVQHTAATDWIGKTAADESEDDEGGESHTHTGPAGRQTDHSHPGGGERHSHDDEPDRTWDKKASLDNTAAVEASLWFTRVSAAVKADREEFAEQAQGMAARVAGAYGSRADVARRAFLDRVSFLHRQATKTAEVGPDKVKEWGIEDVTGRDPLMVDPEQSLADEDQAGWGESSLPVETEADLEAMDAEFWDDGQSHAVPSTRAPNVTGTKTAAEGEGAEETKCSKCDSKAIPGAETYTGKPACYIHEDKISWEERTNKGKTGKTAAEGGSTCSVCGDPIERDPAGEDPRTWHHTNGEKHDHEANPGGGTDSKESSFREVTATPGVPCAHCGLPVDTSDPGYAPEWGDVQMHERCLPLEGIRTDDDRREWWNRVWNAADEETRAGWEQMGVTPTNNSIRQSTLADKQNGNATSGLPLEPEGDDVDEPMWPWEIGEKKKSESSVTAGWVDDLDKGIFAGGIDNVTKGMLQSVLNGLSPDNAAKFAAMPLEQAVTLGWRLVSGGVPRAPSTFAALDERFRAEAADDGSIFCKKCQGSGMVRAGGVVVNCKSCGGSGIKRTVRKKNPDLDDVLPDHRGARVGPGPTGNEDRCQRCWGKGWVEMEGMDKAPTCPDCKGTGIKKGASQQEQFRSTVQANLARMSEVTSV